MSKLYNDCVNLCLYRGFSPDSVSWHNAMMWAAQDLDEQTLSPKEQFFIGTASCLEGAFDKWDLNIVVDSIDELFRNKEINVTS